MRLANCYSAGTVSNCHDCGHDRMGMALPWRLTTTNHRLRTANHRLRQRADRSNCSWSHWLERWWWPRRCWLGSPGNTSALVRSRHPTAQSSWSRDRGWCHQSEVTSGQSRWEMGGVRGHRPPVARLSSLRRPGDRAEQNRNHGWVWTLSQMPVDHRARTLHGQTTSVGVVPYRVHR